MNSFCFFHGRLHHEKEEAQTEVSLKPRLQQRVVAQPWVEVRVNAGCVDESSRSSVGTFSRVLSSLPFSLTLLFTSQAFPLPLSGQSALPKQMLTATNFSWFQEATCGLVCDPPKNCNYSSFFGFWGMPPHFSQCSLLHLSGPPNPLRTNLGKK